MDNSYNNACKFPQRHKQKHFIWFWQYKLSLVEPRKETFNFQSAYLSAFETDYLKTKKILQKIGEEKYPKTLILSKADKIATLPYAFSVTVSIHGKSQAGVLQNANYYQAF